MKRILSLVAGLAMFAISAEAQSYRCENGELVGGTDNVTARCTVNSAGQITSVTPYKATTRDTVKIYRGGQAPKTSVEAYKPIGKRDYRPAPLKPQTSPVAREYNRQGPVDISSLAPEYVVDKSGVSPNGNLYPQARSNVLAATPTPAIQRAAFEAPCNLKIREARSAGNQSLYQVCLTDIDVTSKRSLKQLYSRVKRASRRACGTDYDSIFTRWGRANSQCVEQEMDRVIKTSGINQLQAYHLSKTGKGIPTVYVGDPRYAN